MQLCMRSVCLLAVYVLHARMICPCDIDAAPSAIYGSLVHSLKKFSMLFACMQYRGEGN